MFVRILSVYCRSDRKGRAGFADAIRQVRTNGQEDGRHQGLLHHRAVIAYPHHCRSLATQHVSFHCDAEPDEAWGGHESHEPGADAEGAGLNGEGY